MLLSLCLLSNSGVKAEECSGEEGTGTVISKTQVDTCEDIMKENDEQEELENGWVTIGQDKFYYQDGEKVYGDLQIDGEWYYFDDVTGAMFTGWKEMEGGVQYYEPSSP